MRHTAASQTTNEELADLLQLHELQVLIEVLPPRGGSPTGVVHETGATLGHDRGREWASWNDLVLFVGDRIRAKALL